MDSGDYLGYIDRFWRRQPFCFVASTHAKTETVVQKWKLNPKIEETTKSWTRTKTNQNNHVIF